MTEVLGTDIMGMDINDVKSDPDIASAIALKHSQNTDTGTNSITFAINGNNAIVEGDARLTNARTPIVHDNTYHSATYTTLALVKADSDISSAISLKHTQGTDTGTTATSFTINGTNALTGLVQYIVRQLVMKDEPFVVDNGVVAIIGSDSTASVWCDSNRWWDRLSAGFQSLIDLNKDNLYIINTNEILDIPADSPVERHIDRAAIDTGAFWIR